MYKVGICGHFGEGKNLLNGQTVKTKILTEELAKQLGENEVTTIDTHGWKKNPIMLLIRIFQLSKNCENVIILPATRGVKVFAPLFLLINKLFHRKLHYVVIGGWLPEMLKDNSKLKNQLAMFSGLYVETHTMIKALNSIGLSNVYYIPNFKPLKVLTENELVYPKEETYKLCTFSRVMKEKGIEDAIEAVKKVNYELNRVAYSLDIYGQIEQGYEERFDQLKKGFPRYISYKGLVPFAKSTEVLKNYFALLFPTSYEGEGFPGTVIDAFSAGVPVIATDWRYNSEIITHGENGLIHNSGVDSLSKVLIEAVNKPEKILSIRKNCINEAEKYRSQTVVKKFIEKLELH